MPEDGRAATYSDQQDYALLTKERDRLTYLESIWRLAVDNVDQGAWDYNAATNARFHSDGWKRLRGIKPEEPAYGTFDEWFSRVHPDDKAQVAHYVEKHSRGDVVEWEFAYRELRQDGRWVWILSRGRVVERDETGKPTRLLGTDIDITAVKTREKEQERKERQFYEVHLSAVRAAHAEAEGARQMALHLANFDQLSELPNRRHFVDRLEAQFAAGQAPFAVVLLDVDNFKRVNDRHGHAAGDHVIRATAERLSTHFPAPHFVARLGGDEFGIILQLPLGETLDALLEHTAKLTAIMRPSFSLNGVPLASGCSAGAALYPQDAGTATDMLKCADLALYKAKASGKGCSVVFDSVMRMEAERQNDIETHLRQALVDRRVVPFFQPILDAKRNQIIAVEILARWECPTYGMVMPDVFIPVADKLGLLPDLTAGILEQVAEVAELIPDDVSLSFNLSATEICDIATPFRLATLISKTRLPPHRFIFELTEQALVRDSKTARAVVDAMRKLGVKVYLDDFGAGYSGLCYLKDFTFDGLKLDKSFAQSMLTNAASHTILENVLELARQLGIDAVVEGIENETAFRAIIDMGAVHWQGYLHSFPASVSQLANTLVAAQNDARPAMMKRA